MSDKRKQLYMKPEIKEVLKIYSRKLDMPESQIVSGLILKLPKLLKILKQKNPNMTEAEIVIALKADLRPKQDFDKFIAEVYLK